MTPGSFVHRYVAEVVRQYAENLMIHAVAMLFFPLKFLKFSTFFSRSFVENNSHSIQFILKCT